MQNRQTKFDLLIIKELSHVNSSLERLNCRLQPCYVFLERTCKRRKVKNSVRIQATGYIDSNNRPFQERHFGVQNIRFPDQLEDHSLPIVVVCDLLKTPVM